MLNRSFEHKKLDKYVKENEGFKAENALKIGGKEWMTNNLAVQHFRNGHDISLVKTKKEWLEACERKEPACCFYDNRETNLQKFGLLYNWYAVHDYREIAPKGWRIPEHFDWMELSREIENNNIQMKDHFYRALGGYRNYYGDFSLINVHSGWWGKDEVCEQTARLFSFDAGTEAIISNDAPKECGYYIKCIKD